MLYNVAHKGAFSMILPEWTTLNIALYIFFAVLVIGVGPAEYFGMSMMNYSKFRTGKGLPGWVGMAFLYFMPFVALTLVAWSYLPTATLVQWAVYLAVAIHFAKRVLESIFLHRYSGPIDLFTTLLISTFYSLAAGMLGWVNINPLPAPDIWFYVGILLFVVGISVNFYHHKLLADLRKNSLDYFIPKGGLFEYVVCPHYLFEMITFLGIALLSRHLVAWIVLLFIIFYLTARAMRVLKWYHEKFKDFPKDRKAILPFVL
jgi:very-long-chain enoyl-CoA reductase